MKPKKIARRIYWNIYYRASVTKEQERMITGRFKSDMLDLKQLLGMISVKKVTAKMIVEKGHKI